MSKYHDASTSASDPLPLRVSDAKLRRLQPELFGWRALLFRFSWDGRRLDAAATRELIGEHLSFGDSRAALVLGTDPPLVAAFTDELDCVALLEFPRWVAAAYRLRPAGRLLTVNTYGGGERVSPDLLPGPARLGRWASFFPIIADFVSDDDDAIDRRKRAIGTREWLRVARFAAAALAVPVPHVRDGRPLRSGSPGTPMRAN